MINSLMAKVREAGPHARVALAAELADRVYPLYEAYWSGDYSEEIKRSIDLAWAHACGEQVDASEFQACLKEVKENLDYYGDEGIDVLAAAVTVVLRSLQSMVPKEEEAIVAVARALTSAVDAANYAEAMANDETPNARTNVAATEEDAWCAKALAVVDGRHGVAQRNMFDSLGGKPPNWLEDWKVRTAHLW